MESLESILGHSFRQLRLLTEALTHASVSYESQRSGIDNQRLEFLGDAVLQLALSHELFARLPEADEGRLARLASEIGLGPHLIMGRGEETSGGRERDSTLADALEAIIGAIYIDAGLDAAAQFVIRVLGAELDQLGNGLIESNPKGDLQERLQAINSEAPAYRIIGQTGPDHAKFFEAVVTWGGRELGRGAGKSKKEAEVQAASSALANPAFDSLTASTS